jgi:glycosyltransferase involved in cell wall biosynthesis
MNPKISIIVPIYKVEAYINKCVDSIIKQTYKDFELILVDDGSPDNCGQICDEYAKNDNRIKVIHKENGGLSSARNVGLENARGEYIGFVDSDDYINEKMYEVMYKTADFHSSEVVICDFFNVNEDQRNDKNYSDEIYRIEHFTNIQALEQLYKSKPGTFVYAWNKLYKRSLFEDIRFDNGRIYEDEFISHKILYKSNKVTFISNSLYYYVKRTNSILNSPFTIKRFDKVSALKERADFFLEIKQQHLLNHALKNYMETFIWNYFVAKSNLANADLNLKEQKKTFGESLHLLVKNPLIGWKQKLAIVTFVINPFIFQFFINARNK